MEYQVNEIIISSEQIQKRVKALAEEIQQEILVNEEWVILILLKGALFFGTDLCLHLPQTIRIECVRASSYNGRLQSSGTVDFGAFPDIIDKSVLVIDDILDTGLTLEEVSKALIKRGATQVKTCVLLSKQKARTRELEADYSGFSIPNKFVVGYGLDYEEKLRNLPYIGVLS